MMESTAASPLPIHPAPTLRPVDALPGPRGWPLLGNVPQMRPSRVHRVVEDWSRRFGALFRIRFGRTPVLVVASHELVREVLRDRPDGFRRPSVTADVSHELGGMPGVFLAEGQAWRNQRRMVMAGLAPHAVKHYFPSLVAVGLRLRARWQRAAMAGAAIDLASDLKRYSVDIVAGLAFGTDVNTVEGGENVLQQHMDEILAGVARRSMSPIPYWRYFRLPRDRRLERSVAALAITIDSLIAAARARLQADPARAERPGNLLEAMLCAAADDNSGVDDQAVAGNVSTMLLAGEDTTSNTLAWLFYLLKQHPAALARAREEVLRLAPDPASFTVEQLGTLDFVDACAQEAMRLKPVAPFIPLEAARDGVVGDVRVKQGTLLWCVMRRDSVDQAHFARPDAFEPERWLEQGADANGKQVSMPFGAGLRMCPGRYLALLEIKLAVAMVLSSFDVVAVATQDGSAPAEQMDFTMSPVGLRMQLAARRHQAS